jgi:uncharacterized low-complexity protein
MNVSKTSLALALTTALGATGMAVAAENPFSMQPLSQGYMVSDAGMKEGGDKAAEGKCGEGKCGGSKTPAKVAEGSKDTAKAAEGKCGEGKCGGSKKGETTKDAE